MIDRTVSSAITTGGIKIIGRALPYLLASYLILVTIIPGCGRRQAYDKHYYLLSATRQGEPAGRQSEVILGVRNFTIDSAYGGKGLVYRTGDLTYETDFYHEFLISPRSMISEKTRNWLAASRLWERVLDPGSQVDATHLVEGNITALYGDFREKGSPKAVMEMRIFVLETRAWEEPVSVFGASYKSSIDVESEGPEGLVGAFDRCLEEVLTALENDLAEELP